MIPTQRNTQSKPSSKEGSKMLVLTRKTGESIQIGDDITIKIVAVEGDQIKLGIDAPKNVDIHRSEIYQQIIEANQQASLNKDIKDFIKNLKRE